MGSKIEWTDETWNPVRGCSIVSAGCENCYAMRQAARFKAYDGLTRKTKQGPKWTGKIALATTVIDAPLRWARPRRIFVNSMSDLFHEDVPREYAAALFGVMAAAPLHTYQILTKRPELMRDWSNWLDDRGGLGPYIRNHADDIRHYFDKVVKTTTHSAPEGERVFRSGLDPWVQVYNAAACTGRRPAARVWFGTSVEDQRAADERIELLREVPGERFLSVEPLLEPVRLDLRGISLAIVGGESGPRARRCEVGWIRGVADQCLAARVPCYVKQLGSNSIDGSADSVLWHRLHAHPKGGDPAEWPEDLRAPRFREVEW